MDKLTEQTLMTVNELAKTLDVNEKTVARAVKKLETVLSPVAKNSQGGYLLNEKQATLIKKEIQSHHNLASRQIDNVTTELEEMEVVAKAMSILKRKHDEYKQRAELAETKLIEQQPKVEFANTVMESETTFDMGKVAKIINAKGYGRNNLIAFLRYKKVLQSNGTPYQKFVDRGYFKVVESKYLVHGKPMVGYKTVVFQKGVDYISKLLSDNKKISTIED